jgi:NADPH:quinone reductase-like Zn-dependent oxidoreductase
VRVGEVDVVVRRGGGVCLAGFLGGGTSVTLDPMRGDLPSGVRLSFFASMLFGAPGFPLADVPLQELVAKVERGALPAAPAHVFRFDALADAHRLMESGDAQGKIVVIV